MRAVLAASRSRALALGRGLSVPSWTSIVVAVSVAAWLGLLMFMADMDEGPGTPLGTLPVFVTGWVIMLTAMMLPSELNYVGALAVLLRGRAGTLAWRSRVMGLFILGYGVAWLAYGLAAFLLDAAIRAINPEVIVWDRVGPYLAGSVLILAGLYQVSSLKHVCLKGCRSPLSFFARYWRDGDLGAIALGTRHGLVCVGCCWALMAVMFVVGTMSLAWMALLTLFMFAEKVFPKGQKLALPIACFLWAMGIWIAMSPETAPLLNHSMIYVSICHGF